MYDRRERYSNSPLALVTAEVRYPYAPRLRSAETLDKIQIALEEIFPIRKLESRVSVQIGNSGVLAAPATVNVYRFLNRTASHSAVISAEAFTVETTHYSEFDEFLDLILKVGAAIHDVTSIPALERVGLRYIDEVRIADEIKKTTDWDGWLSPGLLPVLSAELGNLEGTQGILVYDLGQGAHLQFQYAAAVGEGVVRNDPLKRRVTPDPGPFFLLDFDGFWQVDSPEESQEFDLELLRQILSRLHVSNGELFQASITDRLRDVFRRSQ